MASPYTQPARGIRKSSAIIDVAAAATPENLYLQSAAGQNARTVILRKVYIWNNTGANAQVQIGQGPLPALGALYPVFYALNGFDNQWTEDEIPEVEVNANLVVQSDVLGVHVQVEVEEIE